MLLLLVRSQKHPYVNLQKQITIWICFVHLKYKSKVNQKIFSCPEETPIWLLHRVFSILEIIEKLYSPYSMYVMDQMQERRLKEYYATAKGIHVNAIGVNF